MASKDTFSRLDWGLIIAVTLISTIGIIMIYSAGFDPIEKTNSGLYQKQMLWFVIGFIVMISITFLNYQSLGDYSIHIYVVLAVALILTSLFAPPIRNVRAWIDFGYFSIQPAEFMKLGFIIIIAKFLEIRERDITRFRELLIPAVLTAIPALTMTLQPDFGTAILFFPILFVMLFMGGADIPQLLALILIAFIALSLPMAYTYIEWTGQTMETSLFMDFFRNEGLILIISAIVFFIALLSYILHFFFVHKIYRRLYLPGFVISLGLFFSILIQRNFVEYQKKRILVFLNPDLDPFGSGYNVIQSKIAVGSGGLTGKGFLQGSQSQLGFLPEKTSDFIFPVIAEEWGFLGSLVIIGFLAYIVYKGIMIAISSKDKFGALLASGITAMFFLHLMINIGMAIGIMPVTGLPLPFVSYGGSFYLTSMISIGILLNINTRKDIF